MSDFFMSKLISVLRENGFFRKPLRGIDCNKKIHELLNTTHNSHVYRSFIELSIGFVLVDENWKLAMKALCFGDNASDLSLSTLSMRAMESEAKARIPR